MPFSVLILTLNEASSLPLLVNKLKPICDDIVILDSFSTDGTQELARDLGCRVYERGFDNEHTQRAFGIKLPFRHSWVYNPDADEIPDDMLIKEMQTAATDNNFNAAYEVRFRNYLDGRWIRHSTDYPVWVVRFFKPETLTFEREINLRYVINGSVGRFNGHFDHFPFSKGIGWWITKHNLYSTKEAEEAVRLFGDSSFWMSILAVFNSRTSKSRRLALKEVSFYFPLRGILRFLYSYFFRLGFLDGRAGFKYSLLIAFYEFLISEKIKELRKEDFLPGIRK
ncbi:glycosyltransferase family 2 protein [Haliea atlantica]